MRRVRLSRPLTRLTRRGWAILGLACALYFFANQTQVGWLYLLSALGAGLWLAALRLPRLFLGHLSFERRVNGSATPVELELYAGDTLQVELKVRNFGRAPALQLRGGEVCPPAPPSERDQAFFVPYLAGHSAVTLRYAAVCGRRGWYEFPDLPLSTRAPFGLSEARRTATVPTGVLVFPECRELKELALFDRMPAAQSTFARPGAGGEFVGVREFRPGDPRRHVHWRSTARAGRLIVKEFAEETQPGLTIALDLRQSSVIGGPDDNSLELGVKLAASLARYAQQRGLPVSLAGNSRAWPAPPGALSWWGLMDYLARVQAEGDLPLDGILPGLTSTTFLAAILSAPDERAAGPLIGLRTRGLGVLAVVVDPARFEPANAALSARAASLAATLQTGGVETRLIEPGPGWEKALEGRSQ